MLICGRSIILAALGLPPDLSGVVPSPHHLARLQEAATSSLSTRDALVESIILEAEMVAYNEDTEDIDEFANLHLCAGLSGDEARYVNLIVFSAYVDKRLRAPILDSSQTDSDGSGDRQLFRHLAVVFFDVLWLNGRNLVLGVL